MKYSEADLILHAISQEGEKLSFIAKGALKSKKRFSGGVLEPTHYVELTYKEARGGQGLRWIEEAKLLKDFQGLRLNYEKLELAWRVVECGYYISQEGDQNSELLFNLLGNTLMAAENCKNENLELLKLHFYLKLLYQQGVISPEVWMGPFLKTSTRESQNLEEVFKEIKHKLPLFEQQIKSYLNSGVTTV